MIHGAGPTDTIPFVFRTASDSVISRQTVMNIDGFTVAIISRLSWTVVRRNTCFQRFFFLHSHGGTGCGSAHKPFFASRASFSRPSSTVSSGAYFRYHQHQPCFDECLIDVCGIYQDDLFRMFA